MIDENRAKGAIGAGKKHGLAIVGVLCAGVDEPSQAESFPVGNTADVTAGKNLPDRISFSSQVARSEAKSGCATDQPGLGFKPGPFVVKKLIGDEKDSPLGDRQTEGFIQLRAHNFVE
jgi:hypothetical protein